MIQRTLALALTSIAVLLGSARVQAEDVRPTPAEAQSEVQLSSRPDPFLASLTFEQKVELLMQARIKRARQCAVVGDILGWGQALFPEKFSLPFCRELHDYFVSIRGDQFTNVEAPRGHAKTTIKCFLIPIYQAMEEPKRFIHYLNVQATSTKADSVNSAIKIEFEENVLLRRMYGNMVSRAKWTESQFILNNGVVFSSIGAGQSIRGINYRNIRPDYILIDDLYDEEDINNPTSTEKKNDWFWGSLYKARAIGRRTSMHVQGTAINSYDLMELLKAKKRWVSKTFKGILDADKGLMLWKELDKEAHDNLMADFVDMPTVIFNREIQNERRDDAESLIKKDWLKTWKFSMSDLRGKLKSGEEIFSGVELGCDPSVGKTMLADFTGISVIIKTRHQDQPDGVFNYWIIGLRNEHLSLNKRVVAVAEEAKRSDEFPANRANIEAIAAFEDFAGEVRRKTNLRVNSISQVKDKITNLENKSGVFESRRIRVSEEIDPKLVTTLEYQLTTNFPKNDDLRDAVLLVLPDLKPRGSWRPIA